MSKPTFLYGPLALSLLVSATLAGCNKPPNAAGGPSASQATDSAAPATPEAKKKAIRSRMTALTGQPTLPPPAPKVETLLAKADSLRLTASQKGKIRAIQTAYRQKIAELEKKAADQRKKANRLAKKSPGGEVDLAAVRRPLKEANSAVQQKEELEAQAYRQALRLLSASQKAALQGDKS